MKPRSRRLRWTIGLAVVFSVLVAYALALHWFALRVESGIQNSIRELPVTDDDTAHRGR